MLKKQLFLSYLLVLMTFSQGWSQTVEDYFKPLKYRNIGPFRGGRSVSATGVYGDALTYYMGTTGGGLWKTSNAGNQWENISDGFFEMGSVGAIAVAKSNTNILYCGMGEHAPRGVMTSYGDGVYKSTDAGKTWKKMGLAPTQHISRIIIHPTNPDIVLVAAQGALHGPTKERGIYKSTDGGQTWKNVLFVNDLTGCSELSIDANYPEIMYATMWEHQRTPNMVISGGKGSGVYKSIDGGETWFLIHKGLPEEKGKMAIAVSPSNSNKVFLLLESDSEQDKGGLFVSNDAGLSWSFVSGDNRLTQRAWYYIELFVDPNNENTIYVLSAPAMRSEDGGRTWETLSGTHGDYHDLWINPENSKNFVIANDGGAAVSFDYGKSWSPQDNMPTAQFYRINTDNLFPYNIYAGQQDNSSVKIASLAVGSRSISDKNWSSSAGGESAFLAFNPDNPRFVMGGSYLGTIEVLDTQTNTSVQVMAAPIQYLGRDARDMKYLYNWNAPIIASIHEPGVFYHGAQLVLRTKDMGNSWEEISPDLTRNIDEKQGKGGGPYTNEAVGAENYGTIAYMIESPHEKGVFWTGSDDGFVHITKDNGLTWFNVTPKDLGETLVNAIEVSPHDKGTAYIATTKYKFNDYTPAVFKTTDYGKSWVNISKGLPYGSFTRVVREDTTRKDVLYLGTEKGIYISYDGGKKWETLQLNMPKTPILDLKVHQNNLIVATSGRSFWVLDDLSVLNQYKGIKETKLYQPAAALNGSWGSPLNSNSDDFDGTDLFDGINPANGMVLYYELPKIADDEHITLEILNDKGQLVQTFSSKKDENYKSYAGAPPRQKVLPKNEGLNRFVWDLRHATMSGVYDTYIEADFRGHKAIPGTYTLKLNVNGKVVSTEGIIKLMPGLETMQEQYVKYDEFMKSATANVTTMHNKINTLFEVQSQLKAILKNIKEESLKKEGQTLVDQLQAWDGDMIQRKSKAYDDVENFPNKFTAEYLFLINQTANDLGKLNESSIARKAELDNQWIGLNKKASMLLENEIPAYNAKLWSSGVGAIRINN
ncbi:MAG: glycosyl hydrolase [Cellulophaga sp.]|nr:glycosyl hydrolase [Cellulophaga sp.]